MGGKAAALGRLIRAGALVPAGFVVPPSARLEVAIAHILAAFDALGSPRVAVRSSAAAEDGQSQSWAGQFQSYLAVPRGDLLRRIQDCRDSGATAHAQAYSTGGPVVPAVIVQAMVQSDVSGVLFTVNPITKHPNEIMIEAVYGLGELLVQGLATPDNYLVEKTTGRVIQQAIAEKTSQMAGGEEGVHERSVPTAQQLRPALSPTQIAELVGLSTQLEINFGYPLDIEWAYAKGNLSILQARPITTL